jgi:TolA-binding protein
MKTFKKILNLFFLACFIFCINAAYAESEQSHSYLASARRLFSQGLYDLTIEALSAEVLENFQNENRDEAYILIGKAYFHKGLYAKALGSFGEALNSRSLVLKEDALYWCGEANFKLARYDNAISLYQRLIDNYPLSAYIPYAYYSKGWAYSNKNDLNAALNNFKHVVDNYPDSKIFPSAVYKIAETYYHMPELNQAKEAIDAYLEKFPLAIEAKDALFLKGEILYKLGHYSQAVAPYRYSLELTGERPWNIYAKLGIAWSLFHSGDYEKAVDEFQGILKTDFSEQHYAANALIGLGRCYSRLNMHHEAINSYDRVIDIFTASRYIEDAYFQKAGSLFAMSHYEQAEIIYRDFLKKFPESKLLPETYYNLASTLLRLHMHQEAIGNFQKAGAVSDDIGFKVDCICRIADAYFDMGDYREAQKHYDEVLDKYQDHYYADYAQYRLGETFMGLGEAGSAIITFKSLINNFPNSGLLDKALLQLADAYYIQGHYELANREYNNIIENFKDSQAGGRARYKIGIHFYNTKDYLKAVEIFTDIINTTKDKEMERLSRYELGWCYYQMGEEALAIRTFDDYLMRYPESDITADVIYWFAQYYYGKGSYGRVKISLNRISEGFPDSGLEDRIDYLLAWTFYREGRIREAAEQFERVLEKHPDTDSAEKAIIALGDIIVEAGRYSDAIDLLNNLSGKIKDERLEKVINKKIGLIYQSEGFYNIAVTYYRKAITADNNDFNAELQFKIAECLEDESRFEEAISEYHRVGYVYPKSGYWSTRARLRIAQIFENQHRWNEARKIYEDIALEGAEEAKYAKERIAWMEKYKDEL